MATYGPYLRYVNIDQGQDATFWTGSAMLVAPMTTPAPVMTISSESSQSRTIEASKIAATSSHNFYRFPIRLPMKEEPQCFSYGFPDIQTGYTFHIPALDDPYWRCSFTSCNGFTDDVSGETRKQMGGVRPLWDDMLRKHAQMPYYVMLGGGDQIYCDDVWKLESLREWLKIKGKDNRKDAEWTEKMDEEVDSFYFNHYCNHFSSDGIREAYAKIPQVNVCDDHDCFDGFGSFPEYLEQSNVFQNLRRIGYKYFLLFQHQTSVDADRTGMFIEGTKSYSVISHLGKSMSALMLDTRNQRTREHIILQDEWDATFSALEKIPRSTRHLLVVTGVPIIYPRLEQVESLLSFVGNAKKATNKGFNVVTKGFGKGVGVVSKRAEASIQRGSEKVKLKMGKSGMMSKVLNDFGEVSLDDDLIDHWTNKHHEQERSDAIARFQKLSADHNMRITFIAGDVHCATVGRLFNPKNEKDQHLMYQVVSSAVVNAPPPTMVLKKVHKSCAKGNAKPKKYGDSLVETHEEMIELFKTDVDGKSAPAARKKLMGRRNWCSIQVGHDVDDELEFTLMIENEDWQKDTVPYGIKVPPM